jgi:hypothetical protein
MLQQGIELGEHLGLCLEPRADGRKQHDIAELASKRMASGGNKLGLGFALCLPVEAMASMTLRPRCDMEVVERRAP